MRHKFTQPRTEERECEKAGWKMAAQVCIWPNIWQIWGLGICFVFSWQETKLFNVTSFLQSEKSNLSFCGHLLSLFHLNSIWLNPKDGVDTQRCRWHKLTWGEGKPKTSIQNTQTGRESCFIFYISIGLFLLRVRVVRRLNVVQHLWHISKLSSLWSFYEPPTM